MLKRWRLEVGGRSQCQWSQETIRSSDKRTSNVQHSTFNIEPARRAGAERDAIWGDRERTLAVCKDLACSVVRPAQHSGFSARRLNGTRDACTPLLKTVSACTRVFTDCHHDLPINSPAWATRERPWFEQALLDASRRADGMQFSHRRLQPASSSSIHVLLRSGFGDFSLRQHRA